MNIEPMKVIRFFLTYEELLHRTDGKYRHVTTISSRQVSRCSDRVGRSVLLWVLGSADYTKGGMK